ncbi:MAG: hypothetical protein M0R80_23635 [Proteobacteria bacterium]|jgi:hypothetical protein|nr:hypothetical protein [Pseudomonadota bacterium]
MKAKFNFGKPHNFEENGSVTFVREAGDPTFYGIKHAKGEHALFYFIKKWLNERGFTFIKKCAQKDGCMVGDEFQPYLRWATMDAPCICIISGFYALRGANEDWNKGEVTLNVHADEGAFTFVQDFCSKELSCARN